MDVRLLIIASLFSIIQSTVINLTCRQKKQFIDRHDYLRLQLANGEVSGQPAAVEMKSIIWDEELAAKATKWASNNKFSHNPDKTIGSKRFTTGENIYTSSSNAAHYEVDIYSVVDSWFNEHNDYTYGPLTADEFNKDINPIGHYTQVVWSDSTYIGCGISETVTEDGYKKYYVVCNYGPAGNLLSQVPYKSGPKGSGALICEKNYYGTCDFPYGKSCNHAWRWYF